MTRIATTALVLVLLGCSKTGGEGGAKPSASAASAASAKADAAAAATTIAITGTALPTATRFQGKYVVAAAAIYVPDGGDWKGVRGPKDDPSKMVGEGSIDLAVDGAGNVRGTIEDGPAGPAIVEGARKDKSVTATVRRKDVADDGLTGTIVGSLEGDAFEGTMKLANVDGAIVREAKITTRKK